MTNPPNSLTLAFNVLKSIPFEPVLLVPLGFVGVGLLMTQGYFMGRSNWSSTAKSIFAWQFLAIAGLIAAITLWSFYGEHLRAP